MHFIRQERKAFVSSILKRKLSHTDKSDPDKIKVPKVIQTMKESTLDNKIEKFLKKYKQKNYSLYSREVLNEDKNWDDLYTYILIFFYKKRWSIEIDQTELYFPNFIFTYSIESLQEKIDNIISKAYDINIDEDIKKDMLKEDHTYTALDFTYLLYYLTLNK